MKRLCLIIPSLKQGGMERVMSELANHWANQGHEVHLIMLVRHNMFYNVNSLIFLHFPSSDYKNNRASKLWFKFKTVAYIRKTVNKLNPDSVLSFGEYYNNIVLLSLFKSTHNVFISDRGNPIQKLGLIDDWLRDKLYPLSKGMVAQTSFAKEVNENSRGLRNVRVIPNPIKKIHDYGKITNDKKVILNIGRLVPEKNQKELIDIFKEAFNPLWSLVIVGDGPLKAELENHINYLNLNEHVHLVGSTTDVDKYMANADIFAFTSISEGFPNSLCEALAYPLASISYDCLSGPKDIIEDGKNGVLIPIGDKEKYILKLKELMNNPSYRKMLCQSSFQIRETLSIDKISSDYLDFITQG